MDTYRENILKIAAEICRLYSDYMGSRISQDWVGTSLTELFTESQIQQLAYNFELNNSNLEDYDPNNIPVYDGMMVSSYIADALDALRNDLQEDNYISFP
jgi:hypothetical protein